MRASAKWIMGIVAVTFVGWMVFEVGMDATARGASAGNVVARVNGRSIDATTFYQAVRNEQERRRAAEQPQPITLEEQQQLEDAVLEQLVQEIILRDEFSRRGIRVSDQEIVEAARTSPPPEVLELPQFQTDGQFDLQKYQRFVASAADPTFLLALEARYREELPRIKLYEQLTAGVYVSDAALWREYRDRNDSVTIALVQLTPQGLGVDSAPVSDAEVEAYYRARRSDFEAPAAVSLSFVAVSRRPDAGDSAAALERARAVRAELQGGADFADVAARESADSVSRAQGGDLGEVPRGSFVPEFERAALALRPGQISDPIPTQFGHHIIRLESRTDSTLHARHILIPVVPVGEHLATVEAMADTLDLFAAEQEDPTALDRVAERLGLPVARAPMLFEGDRLQLGRFLVPDAGVWAFGGAQMGETSPVIETDYAYYVFRIDSLRPAGVPPLAQIRESVRALAGAEKQRQAMRARADSLRTEIRGAASLERVAERYGLAMRTLGPFTRYEPPTALQSAPEVVGAAFGLRVGQTGGPIHTEFSSFFLRPIRKIQADSSAWLAQLETQRLQMIRRARQERVQLVLASLREQANIRDLRKELQRAQREAQDAPRTPVMF